MSGKSIVAYELYSWKFSNPKESNNFIPYDYKELFIAWASVWLMVIQNDGYDRMRLKYGTTQYNRRANKTMQQKN